MTKVFFTAFLTLLSARAIAQGPAPAPTSAHDQFHQLELAWMNALADQDVQALEAATYPPSPFAPAGGPVSFLVTDTWVRREASGRW